MKATYYYCCHENPINITEDYDEDDINNKDIYKKKLKKIIDYSYKNSNYYKNKFSKYDLEKIEEDEVIFLLKNLPFLEKENLRGDAVNKIKIETTKGLKRETTGSTGIPVSVYVDRNTVARQLSARWMFFSWHGILPGAKEGRFWGRLETQNLKLHIKNFLLNRRVFQLDQRNIDRFTKDLKEIEYYKPDYFYGYASLLLRAAEFYDHTRRTRPQPKVIFSTAEMLSETQREYIASIFNCPVYQEYGCSEVDIIAFECQHKRFHINKNRLYTEFLNTDSNLHETVITDLDNICTPIIRYKIGDLVETTEESCPCGRPLGLIKKISGRTNQQLVSLPHGGFFHAVKFAHIIEELCQNNFIINRYRVEHTSPSHLKIKLMIDRKKYNCKYIEEFILNKISELTFSQISSEVIFDDIDINIKNSYYIKLYDDTKSL